MAALKIFLIALPLSTVSNGIEHRPKFASFLNCDLFEPQITELTVKIIKEIIRAGFSKESYQSLTAKSPSQFSQLGPDTTQLTYMRGEKPFLLSKNQ